MLLLSFFFLASLMGGFLTPLMRVFLAPLMRGLNSNRTWLLTSSKLAVIKGCSVSTDNVPIRPGTRVPFCARVVPSLSNPFSFITSTIARLSLLVHHERTMRFVFRLLECTLHQRVFLSRACHRFTEGMWRTFVSSRNGSQEISDGWQMRLYQDRKTWEGSGFDGCCR
jgi:hypothetical protein